MRDNSSGKYFATPGIMTFQLLSLLSGVPVVSDPLIPSPASCLPLTHASTERGHERLPRACNNIAIIRSM